MCVENVFLVRIAWYKHERGWENSRQLCKPETKSRVCITVKNSPNRPHLYIRLCKHRKKVFCCFYKIPSSKNYNAGKDKKFILLIKFYLPTTLIWQWDFSTDQSKLTFWKCGGGLFTTWVSLRHTTMFTYWCKHASWPIRARVLSQWFDNQHCCKDLSTLGFYCKKFDCDC